MNYDVDYFINKFEAIPEEMWCVGLWVDSEGRKCALGHCMDAKANIIGCHFYREEQIALKNIKNLLGKKDVLVDVIES